MKLNHFAICALAASAFACGGSGADPEFLRNAPSQDRYSLSISDADLSSPAASTSLTEALTTDPCHPHLFARTDEIVGRVNRHFGKLLGLIADAIADNPRLKSSTSHAWESIKNGIDRKFTMTKTVNADGSVTYAFELDIAAVNSTGAAPSFVKVFSGSETHSGSAGAADAGVATASESSGSLLFDFDALKSVVTTETSAGQISDAFDVKHDPVNGVRRTATVTLTNFLPEEGDPHGPRNGGYIWEREPGKGGSFVYDDTLVLLCPSNPNGLAADLLSVARWYHTADGSIHGRADAKATGGQIPAGDTWMGVTCAQGGSSTVPAEAYWMMKLEDSSGGTVEGHADTTGAAPCDPALGGPAPSVSSNANDFAFASVSTSEVYRFPNQW